MTHLKREQHVYNRFISVSKKKNFEAGVIPLENPISLSLCLAAPTPEGNASSDSSSTTYLTMYTFSVLSAVCSQAAHLQCLPLKTAAGCG